jgi:polyhydroxyalkanoate synthesis regulator phasin
MSEGDAKSDKSGVPESLRTAVERTLSATERTATETAERAQELLDEVARRGRQTRDDLSGIRFASAREVAELRERVKQLEARVEALQDRSKSQPEG